VSIPAHDGSAWATAIVPPVPTKPYLSACAALASDRYGGFSFEAPAEAPEDLVVEGVPDGKLVELIDASAVDSASIDELMRALTRNRELLPALAGLDSVLDLTGLVRRWQAHRGLAELKGVGPLVLVLGLGALAQFMTHTSWVLYTTFKFGWGPTQNGWSLFAIGLMSVLVQGVLLGRLLKRFSPQRLVVMGLISSSLCYVAWGAVSEGWMLLAVIFVNVLGFAAPAAMQSLISNAADPSTQGRTAGAVASLNSMMAVVAPAIGAPLLATVSHLPHGDWRIGAPMYFCAALQATGMLLALRHFKGERRRRRALADPAAHPSA